MREAEHFRGFFSKLGFLADFLYFGPELKEKILGEELHSTVRYAISIKKYGKNEKWTTDERKNRKQEASHMAKV